ncbi:MAG: DUF3006 domain-containing protein [Ruminococcaceae bacterium]|nr:DUF3006 domain-containing protein [Oscillospiraceae bacterium]
MKLTVDRIEEDFAVLEKEDMSHESIPVSLLPAGTKEGSVLTFDGTTYTLDPDAEAEARARIISKQRSIFKKK